MARVNWKDRMVERPRTYEQVQNADGTVTLNPSPGQVIEEGTPVNAVNLNEFNNSLDAKSILIATNADNIQRLNDRLILSTASADVNAMQDGDIWIKYGDA